MMGTLRGTSRELHHAIDEYQDIQKFSIVKLKSKSQSTHLSQSPNQVPEMKEGFKTNITYLVLYYI